MSKDVLDEPWTDMTAWTNNDSGSGLSEIDPAGQLHQITNLDGHRSELNKTLSDTGTSYTIEIKSVVDLMPANSGYYANWALTNFGDLRLTWGWDTNINTDPFVQLAAGSVVEKYYTGIAAFHEFRVLLSTSPIPATPKAGGGGWFLF